MGIIKERANQAKISSKSCNLLTLLGPKKIATVLVTLSQAKLYNAQLINGNKNILATVSSTITVFACITFDIATDSSVARWTKPVNKSKQLK